MATLFLFLAVIGGTILVCQFVLTLIGLGSDGTVPDDMPDGVPHDLHFDASGADVGHADVSHVHGAHGHDASWLFGVISFRTLVAAITFFGLAGLSANAAGLGMPLQLMISSAAGVAALLGTHYVLRLLGRLGEDATVRIHKALGKEGTVYVPIAAGGQRSGKVHLKLQNRLMEYEAVTSAQDKLATGTRVRVVAIRGNLLEVEPVGEAAVKTA
jgi:membrane protein implicated in regulation of membrane protease activity